MSRRDAAVAPSTSVPREPAVANRLDTILRVGVEQLGISPPQRVESIDISLKAQVHQLGQEIAMKRAASALNPAAAAQEEAGPPPLETQRLQSYYVVAQEGDPVLFVIKGWFMMDNRFIFDAFVRAAQLPLDISQGNFYELDCSRPNVSFEQLIKAFNVIRQEAAYYARSYSGGARPNPYEAIFDDPEVRNKLLKEMPHVANLYGQDSLRLFADAFAANLAMYTDEFADTGRPGAVRPYKHPYLRAGQSSPFEKFRVPAAPDSMVFFAGPHHVSGDPVRRLCAYVHSVNEQGARKILADHPVQRGAKPSYTDAVAKMVIPPNAQGKTRSPLIDKFLREANANDWGWTTELNPRLPDILRESLLIDRASIDAAPDADPTDPRAIEEIRTSMKENSCYVKYGVLYELNQNPDVPDNVKIDAENFENWVLNCVITVINRGLEKQEELKTALRNLLSEKPELVALPENAIEPFLIHLGAGGTEPRHHAKLLKDRLAALPFVSKELKEFAFNVLLRSQRKATSKSWDGRPWEDEHKPWCDAYNNILPVGGKNPYKDPVKIMLSAAEREAVLAPAPDGTLPLTWQSPLGLPDTSVDSRPSDYSRWTFIQNISGLAPAVEYRKRLFSEGRIPHPHIGAWVSAGKPWCPSVLSPVGNWQNVYQILTLGMFDSHYMPRHCVLRMALKPIITQAWHALSREDFKKVLFCPERFNIRELPRGGSALKWHTDQPAIYPVCPEDRGEDASEGFLDDTRQGSILAPPGGGAIVPAPVAPSLPAAASDPGPSGR
tara:strand:- start:774 stop:3110 length:2337 start_codon:yes stop_codon:yes gene_type:complete